MDDKLNLYSVRFVSEEAFITGIAIIAASQTSDAEMLLKTTGALKDYQQGIEEMVLIQGSAYCGEPVLIKEYLFSTI